MKGVRFGNYHSYNDWGLILSEKEIQSPEPKIMEIEIEGGDGVLDLTEFFGDVKYKNRSLSFSFTKMNIVPDGFLALYSLVQNTIHGKVMDVVLDDDPAYFYRGRVTINEWKSDRSLGNIVIEVQAGPWKYKKEETVVSQAVNGTSIITLTNSRMKLIPKITIDSEMAISFDGYSGTFAAGTFTMPDLVLEEGENLVTVTGTGNVSFKYREGSL